MASDINQFGVISKGIDRAQFDVAPPVKTATDPRPPPEALKYQKPSIRRAVGDNLLSVVVHPQHGIKKIRAAVKEKREVTAKEHQEGGEGQDYVPTLAPSPPFTSVEGERLEHELDEKRQIPPLKEFIHQPYSAVLSTIQDQRGSDFAEDIMQPEVSHGASVELVRQSDKIAAAMTEGEKAAEVETFTQMKQLRQDAYVRWSIDRHVRRVGRTQLLGQPPERPPLFGEKAVGTTAESWRIYGTDLLRYEVETYAENYVDNNYELPQPNRKTLASSFERVVIASTSLQNMFMKLRDISRWENPSESAGYMVLYFILLVFSQITRMIILFVLVKVLYRRWHPSTVDEIRDTLAQSENKDGTAKSLTDLVTQYGTSGWVDRAIDNVGPELFDWLEYVADMLEMTQNFYEWRNAQSTAVTLCVLFAWWLLITMTPTWLLVQMIFSFIGFDFFVLTPLAVRHQRYRLLTSPWIWLMWKIPTHAEWSIARLQAEAMQHLAEEDEEEMHVNIQHSAKHPNTCNGRTLKKPRSIGSYSCTGGSLVVTTANVSFSPRRSADIGWQVSIQELKGMQKITETSKAGEYDGLLFESFDGSNHRAAHLDRRDEVFSQIVGYSGLPWKRTG